jgi:Tfp pilus assembly major pilin PilA
MAASRRNRYSRSTTGLNAIGFFASQVAYTSAATYSAFVTSAATAANNGQMGIFLYPALTLQSGAANLNAGDRFFIAQIVDGDIKKSPVMTYDSLALSYTNPAPNANLQVRRTAYSAPVLQSVALGYNGTSGDLGMPTTAPTAPITYTVSARDTSPSTQPFPVQSGTIINKIASSKTDLAFALASDFVNATDYEKNSDVNFCTMDVKTNGTATAIATVTATFVNGSNIVTYSSTSTLAVNDILEVTATGFSYKIVGIISTTVAILDRPYQGASFTTAGGGTAKKTVVTAVGLYVTSIVEDTTFVLSYNTIPVTIAPTVITAWKQGSGAAWQMADMERDTAVMSGYTNANAPFIEDMGKPTFFVSNPETSAAQYTTHFLRYRNTTESMAYANEQASSFGYIIIGTPNGTSPDAQITKILTNI